MQKILYFPNKAFPPRSGNVFFDTIALKPGTNNHLSADDIAALKAHPDFPQYEKWGAIEIVGTVAEIKPVAASSLSQLSAEEAEKTIESTHDAEKLAEWMKNESRITVRRALNRRIQQIKSGDE
ncbi:MAG: hypothetical protein KME60_13630 [Cyanomargarita calcarea GSE-NOS-MK-12-04C]|jgi:hypothetical protein|uniref:Uncharacterized protein n=1 Tax=Cyanomargarita calcarea GSE-NOS-MK-12-04C TaxID=2839659 RepID=A0A951UV14_9CYAN|nr:hypothetical protein [Cyanomargarita calcarea GSE-NOS-MK-12-04C]